MKRFFLVLLSALLALMLLSPLCVSAEENAQTEKKQVSISFDSKSGTACETIYGYAGETVITKDMLPTPQKDGYIFKNWRHFNEYGADFELEVFPNYDIKLVAHYEPNGFVVTFEEGLNSVYDYNSGIELYAPDTKGYKQEFVKEGWRCLKTKAGLKQPQFLLSYPNKLEVGKEYEFSVWIKSEKNSASGQVDFIYTENPDVRAKQLGYTNAFSLKDMPKGEWCEYTVKLIAAAPYIIARLPNEEGILIDNIKVECTGITGNQPELKAVKGEASVLIYAVAAAILFTLVCIVLFWIKRKRKG